MEKTKKAAKIKKEKYLCMFVKDNEELALNPVYDTKYVPPNLHIQKAYNANLAAVEFAEMSFYDHLRDDEQQIWEGDMAVKVRLLSGGDWRYYKMHKFTSTNFMPKEFNPEEA